MSKVKDLMHAILNENIDDIDDEEVIEDTVEQSPVEEPTFVEPKIKSNVQPQVQVFTEPKVEPVQEKKSSIFDGMDFESISSNRPRTTRKSYKYDRSKLSKKNRLAEDLEYTPIISPIFGNTVEEKKQFEKVHNAIKLNKPEDDFQFVKIISPMYGNDIPTPKPVTSIPTKNVAVEEQADDIALDDMLGKDTSSAPKQEALFKKD